VATPVESNVRSGKEIAKDMKLQFEDVPRPPVLQQDFRGVLKKNKKPIGEKTLADALKHLKKKQEKAVANTVKTADPVHQDRIRARAEAIAKLETELAKNQHAATVNQIDPNSDLGKALHGLHEPNAQKEETRITAHIQH